MSRRFPVFAVAGLCGLVAASALADGPFHADCQPRDIVLDWPVPDVADLPARARGDIQPTHVDVPALAPMVSTLSLDYGPADAPLLAAPYRDTLPPRGENPLLELPPSRGAPSLPDAALPVPEFTAPWRGELLPASAPPLDLAAPSRTLELGERYGPILDDSLACAPALVIASPTCRLSARAKLRRSDWPEP